jgi:hypothetical protein
VADVLGVAEAPEDQTAKPVAAEMRETVDNRTRRSRPLDFSAVSVSAVARIPVTAVSPSSPRHRRLYVQTVWARLDDEKIDPVLRDAPGDRPGVAADTCEDERLRVCEGDHPAVTK